MGPLSSAAGSLLPQSLGISSCDRHEVQTQKLWYFPRVISQTLVCYPGTKPVIRVQTRGGRQSCPSAAGSHKPPGLCNGASPHLQFNQAASICPPSAQVGCKHLSTGSLWRSSYSLFPFPWWREVCSPSPAAPNLVGTAAVAACTPRDRQVTCYHPSPGEQSPSSQSQNFTKSRHQLSWCSCPSPSARGRGLDAVTSPAAHSCVSALQSAASSLIITLKPQQTCNNFDWKSLLNVSTSSNRFKATTTYISQI